MVTLMQILDTKWYIFKMTSKTYRKRPSKYRVVKRRKTAVKKRHTAVKKRHTGDRRKPTRRTHRGGMLVRSKYSAHNVGMQPVGLLHNAGMDGYNRLLGMANAVNGLYGSLNSA
jgi:hypothetical protein